MKMSSNDHLELPAVPSGDVDHQQHNLPPDTASQGVMDYKREIGEEERRNILEVIASTGKYWLDWEKLKSLLSFQLKQVLSSYPEVKMPSKDQNSLLGETYDELVKRLDEELCSFVEGPPFTLQRLCEILLSAKDIYPKLSKLALALEKNLLVTSFLKISTDPYPPPVTKNSEKTVEIEKNEEPQSHSDSVKNEVQHDKDEVTAGREEARDGHGDAEMKVEEVQAADDGNGSDAMKVDEAPKGKSELPNPDPLAKI